MIIRTHEGPDARDKRQRPGLDGMDNGFTIDHIVESGKLITLFSAPDYPQFQVCLGSFEIGICCVHSFAKLRCKVCLMHVWLC